MDSNKLKKETFLGVVVDNKDPFKVGRCKIKVFQVFDRLEVADIPWATPWKDLNGNEFTLPEVGKIVSVVFDQGNKYAPEYIYAQNYNINLERKLRTLSDEDYTSMRAVLFDHSTQIYRNQTEGLKIDHEYTNINLDQYGNIMMNLRDNNSIITLGSRDADEEIILGTTFMDWFDDFVSCLLGTEGGAYIDKTAAPVTAGPRLAETLLKYSQIRSSFLSNHIRAPKNDLIIPQSREYINQKGDLENATREIPSPAPSSIVDGEAYSSKIGKNSNPAERAVSGDGVDSEDSISNDDLNAEVKKARAKTVGGKTMKICGRERKNGEVDDLLVEIRKDLYLRHWSTVCQSDSKRIRLQRNMMRDVEALLIDSYAQGIYIKVNSAYRTFSDQTRVWKSNCENEYGTGKCIPRPGKSRAATPGFSPHGFGLAVDLANSVGTRINRTKTPKEWAWLEKNKAKYNLLEINSTDESHHFNYQKPGTNC